MFMKVLQIFFDATFESLDEEFKFFFLHEIGVRLFYNIYQYVMAAHAFATASLILPQERLDFRIDDCRGHSE